LNFSIDLASLKYYNKVLFSYSIFYEESSF
jgi:hypothetical protein